MNAEHCHRTTKHRTTERTARPNSCAQEIVAGKDKKVSKMVKRLKKAASKRKLDLNFIERMPCSVLNEPMTAVIVTGYGLVQRTKYTDLSP